MSKKLRILALISGLILAGNLIHGRYNMAVAEVCGAPCDSYTECSGTCYICFPNPVSPKAGSCISQNRE